MNSEKSAKRPLPPIYNALRVIRCVAHAVKRVIPPAIPKESNFSPKEALVNQ